jgi:hypothetical protein
VFAMLHCFPCWLDDTALQPATSCAAVHAETYAEAAVTPLS